MTNDRANKRGELPAIAEAMARAMGHTTICRGVVSGRCSCGAAQEQAKALDDYQHWKYEYNQLEID